MILIAESGSTKTDWRLVNADGSVDSFSTIGFNRIKNRELSTLQLGCPIPESGIIWRNLDGRSCPTAHC